MDTRYEYVASTMQKFQAPGCPGDHIFLTGHLTLFWVLILERAACDSSGASNFEVASRVLKIYILLMYTL